MQLEIVPFDITVCKVADMADIDLNTEFYFIGRTDEENSLVCKTVDVPEKTLERDDGWRGFRIQGILDFSLIGILARIANVLAENEISIFAVSTYNTDYVLVKNEVFDKVISVLGDAGYSVQSITL